MWKAGRQRGQARGAGAGLRTFLVSMAHFLPILRMLLARATVALLLQRVNFKHTNKTVRERRLPRTRLDTESYEERAKHTKMEKLSSRRG